MAQSPQAAGQLVAVWRACLPSRVQPPVPANHAQRPERLPSGAGSLQHGAGGGGGKRRLGAAAAWPCGVAFFLPFLRLVDGWSADALDAKAKVGDAEADGPSADTREHRCDGSAAAPQPSVLLPDEPKPGMPRRALCALARSSIFSYSARCVWPSQIRHSPHATGHSVVASVDGAQRPCSASHEQRPARPGSGSSNKQQCVAPAERALKARSNSSFICVPMEPAEPAEEAQPVPLKRCDLCRRGRCRCQLVVEDASRLVELSVKL